MDNERIPSPLLCSLSIYQEEALEMIDAFYSIGTRTWDLTRMDIDRRKQSYRPARNLLGTRLILNNWIPLCWKLHQNLIVRPRRAHSSVIAQLDDLGSQQLDRIASRAFLYVETSPGNYQVWLAIPAGSNELVKQVMAGIGADSRATCSGRIAGSPNVKPKYAPDFPAVRIVAVNPGRLVAPGDLEDLVPCIAQSRHSEAQSRLATPNHDAKPFLIPAGRVRSWPDYDLVLAGAPPNHNRTGPDRSKADFLWCKWAIERGHNAAAVEERLRELSTKAASRKGEGYIRDTVAAAAKAARL